MRVKMSKESRRRFNLACEDVRRLVDIVIDDPPFDVALNPATGERYTVEEVSKPALGNPSVMSSEEALQDRINGIACFGIPEELLDAAGDAPTDKIARWNAINAGIEAARRAIIEYQETGHLPDCPQLDEFYMSTSSYGNREEPSCQT